MFQSSERNLLSIIMFNQIGLTINIEQALIKILILRKVSIVAKGRKIMARTSYTVQR